MKVVFWLSVCLFCYVYLVYIMALKLCILLLYRNTCSIKGTNDYQPTVTAIISAFNEEKSIRQRIENLLGQDYPDSKIEVIVASDGSTDRTPETIRRQRRLHVRVLDFKPNRGRAAVQNDAMATARGDIVVFTDAETRFDVQFIKKISASFGDHTVGCSVGNLVYENKDTGISASEGIYWKFEKKLRDFESKLGLLATGTGACMAVRRELYRPLSPIDDCDFTTPLDVVFQGYRVIYVPDAIAYDLPPSTIRGELVTRVRQTSKNLVGTIRKLGRGNWLNHPAISFGLFSHKILRWLTAFFLVGALLSNFFLLDELLYRYTMVVQSIFYVAGAVGFVMDALGKQVPMFSSISSFCVACLGMGIGVIRGLLGKAPEAYGAVE